MITIDSYRSTDFEAVKSFVESIQEHERSSLAELKTGAEIGLEYTRSIISSVSQHDGLILLAKEEISIGFASAWKQEDDDPLLREEARSHAYVSDIFVAENYRGKGVGGLLLQHIEAGMKERGCKRIRICSKASNMAAIRCYEAAGFIPYEIILSKDLR